MRLFDVDTRTGKGTSTGAGNQLNNDFVLDAQGVPAVRSEFNPATRSYRVFAARGARWKELDMPATDALTFLGLTADGRAVVVMDRRCWNPP
jgi:hypothetical protein